MNIHHLPINVDSRLRDHLQEANEARAVALSVAFSAVGRVLATPFLKTYEWLQRGRREREAYRALRSLSDHMLRDIGLSRSEIAGGEHAVATDTPEARAAITNLCKPRREPRSNRNAIDAAASSADRRRIRSIPSAFGPRHAISAFRENVAG